MALAASIRLHRHLAQCQRLCSTLISTQGSCSVDEVDTADCAEQNNKVALPADIPMVPKRRDPDAVLKALSSTIEPVEQELFQGRIGPADPLYPQSNIQKMDFIKHNEAGKRAARYVMYRWPNTFRFKKLDWEPANFQNKPLERNIVKDRPHKALWIYNKMKENGEEVSLATRNELLALIAYRGLGCKWTTKKDAAKVLECYHDVSWWPGKQGLGKDGEAPTEEEAEESVVEEEKLSSEKIKDGVKIWRLDNGAELLFREMKDRDGDSYEALIQGLVKHKNFRRAFEIFDEMRNKGFQAHTHTYCLLLSTLLGKEGQEAWTKVMSLLRQMASEDAVAWPNTDVFNLLLRLAAESSTPLESTRRVTREMFSAGVKPSLTTFYWLNKTYSDRGGHVLGEILDYIEQNRDILCFQDSECHKFFNAAMETCCSFGTPPLAIRIHRLLESAGNLGLIDKMAYYVNYLLKLTHDAEAIDDLITEYRAIVPLRFIPFNWFYGLLFTAACKAGRYDAVIEFWEHMVKLKVNMVKVETVERFCDGVARLELSAEQAEKCMKLVEQGVKELRANSIEPTPTIPDVLIRLACLVPDVDKAWEYYGWLKELNADASFLALESMLNAHMQLVTDNPDKDREPVMQILETMVKQGMYLSSRQYATEIYDRFNISQGVRDRLYYSFSKNRQSSARDYY